MSDFIRLAITEPNLLGALRGHRRTSTQVSDCLGIPMYDETGRARVQRMLQSLKRRGLVQCTDKLWWTLTPQAEAQTSPQSPALRRSPRRTKGTA